MTPNEHNARDFMAALRISAETSFKIDVTPHETAEHVITGTMTTSTIKIHLDFVGHMDYPTMTRIELPDGKMLNFKREL